jgi:hypothetical protein
MVYPYNAIMGRGSINKFEAAIHGLYLCMKISGPQGVIAVYGNQQTVCNIERDFIPGQRNVHCLTTQREVSEATRPTTDKKVKAQLQSNDDTKTVPLDPATPKQTVVISEDLTSQDEEKLIFCPSRNKDVFAWSALDLVGVSRTVIEHSLGINPSVRPKKQRLRKMSDEKTEATKVEVHRLLEANFIEPVAYPTWLANVVMVQKKSGKWSMCIDFTNVNKACPKDNFPLPRIDKIVDSAAGCEVMSLLDCFSGYHQIYMKEEDKASTSFITPFGTYCFLRMSEGLKNAGSTFSRLTKSVLESQVGRNIFTYVDDIVIASRNKEDHLDDLTDTFANMRDARLRLNPEKCVFGVRQGKILGYLVSHRGIEANPTKIQAIINMTPPQSTRDVQRLTGRLATLNRFISKSAERSLPFLKTLRGAKDFAWGPEQAVAFATHKQHLSELEIITSLDSSLPLLLYVAASPHAVNTALVQEQDREGMTRQCSVYYVSEVLTASKCNMTELEKKNPTQSSWHRASCATIPRRLRCGSPRTGDWVNCSETRRRPPESPNGQPNSPGTISPSSPGQQSSRKSWQTSSSTGQGRHGSKKSPQRRCGPSTMTAHGAMRGQAWLQLSRHPQASSTDTQHALASLWSPTDAPTT